jgi:hypothetical protein
MENQTPISGSVRYSSNTPAQRNANKKYRENNKERVNEQRRLYYQKKKEQDPTFLEIKRSKAREYYNKKKQDETAETKAEKIEDIKEDSKAPPKKSETPKEESKDDDTGTETGKEAPATPVKAKRTRKLKAVVEAVKVVVEDPKSVEALATSEVLASDEAPKKPRKPRVKKVSITEEVKTE